MSGPTFKDPSAMDDAKLEEIPSEAEEDASDFSTEDVDDIDSSDISEETLNAEMKRLGLARPIDPDNPEEPEEEAKDFGRFRNFLYRIVKMGEKIGEKIANFFGITDSLFEDEFYVYTRKNEIGGKYFWEKESARKEWIEESQQCVLVEPPVDAEGNYIENVPNDDNEENITGEAQNEQEIEDQKLLIPGSDTTTSPSNADHTAESDVQNFLKQVSNTKTQEPDLSTYNQNFDPEASIRTDPQDTDTMTQYDAENIQNQGTELKIEARDIRLKVGKIPSPNKRTRTPKSPSAENYSQLVDESYEG